MHLRRLCGASVVKADYRETMMDMDEANKTINQGEAKEHHEPVRELFDDPETAGRAYDLLLEMGYTHDEIGVIMTEETRNLFTLRDSLSNSTVTDPTESVKNTVKNEIDTTVEGESSDDGQRKNVLKGAGAVSAAGAIGGVIAAVGVSIVAPGFGLIIAGPMAGIGAGLGALIGGMYGVPIADTSKNEEVDKYEAGIKEGKIFIRATPHTSEDSERIRKEWSRIKGVA